MKERMLAGKLYIPEGADIISDYKRAKRLTRLINSCTEEEEWKKDDLLRQLFGHIGQDFWIQQPFHCDYGNNIYIGDHFVANYDCIIIDVCDVTIGDNVLLGPRVGLYTAAHPIDADVRDRRYEYGAPIVIGNSVWIGAHAIVNPGITIGDNVVIGSGSVVTRDIPSGVVAAGNPCRVLRTITEEDHTYWLKQLEDAENYAK
jgi:maltose O-acetyltransferase